jgi:hypothetical protein
VTLESDFHQAWNDFLAEWVTSADSLDLRIESLAAFTGSSVKTLARQVDLLRAELVEKGIEVAT